MFNVWCKSSLLWSIWEGRSPSRLLPRHVITLYKCLNVE